MKLSEISLSTDNLHLPGMVRQALLKPTDISPLSAYYTFKELFGSPNGSFDEAKSQWAYYLRVPGAYLDIYDWRLESWSIGVYEDSGIEKAKQLFSSSDKTLIIEQLATGLIDLEDYRELATKIGEEFLDLIRKHAPKSASKIKTVAAKANRFVLQNPFALYYQSARTLLEEIPETVIGGSDYYRAAFFMFIAAFEGLLNLVYELYLRTELRDDRIYERLSREQIDVKVRLAPLYCECFSDKPIDHRSEVFKQFHSIVNLRNDFIHANFTQPMKRAIISEDGHTFIVEANNRDKNGLPRSIGALTEDDLTLIKNNIKQMIDMLVDNMKPRFRREFRKIVQEDYFEVAMEDGEMIVVEPP